MSKIDVIECHQDFSWQSKKVRTVHILSDLSSIDVSLLEQTFVKLNWIELIFRVQISKVVFFFSLSICIVDKNLRSVHMLTSFFVLLMHPEFPLFDMDLYNQQNYRPMKFL